MSLKDFLGRLLSKSEVPSGSKMEDNWKEKRRSNRVDLSKEETLQVHLLKPDQKDTDTGSIVVTQVKNISLRGCRLLAGTDEEAAKVKPGQVYVASLAIEDFPIPLNVEVVRVIRGKEIAVRFKAPFPRELEKLEKFLEPRCLGLSMREIDPSSIKDNDKEGMRWFHGINDTSLFSWNQKGIGTITQQQLIFLERVVEWREGSSLKTGRIRKENAGPNTQYGWVKSELLEFDENVDKAILDQAEVLLQSMKIDIHVKNMFIDKILESKK